MQTITIHPSKAPPSLRAAKASPRNIRSSDKAKAPQHAGLTREELRQIVIDMIG
jgi:hypothetical protein